MNSKNNDQEQAMLYAGDGEELRMMMAGFGPAGCDDSSFMVLHHTEPHSTSPFDKAI
jgi:hypothetical protein